MRNRDQFTITEIGANGLRAVGPTGTVVFPADYVKAHIELGYAQTSHAGQGRTVDHSLLLIDQSDVLDRAGVYVPMTRGRASNRVLSVSGPDPTPNYMLDRLTEALQRRWIDTRAMSTDPKEQIAAAQATVRHLNERVIRTKQNQRSRPHPLHRAREQRLTKQYDQAHKDWSAAVREHAPETLPPASRRQRPVPPVQPRRRPENPDLGLDL